MPELLRLDLPGVTWADRRDFLGEQNRPFEQIHLAVKLQRIRTEHLRRQSQLRKFRGGKLPLVSQIMNREDGAHRQANHRGQGRNQRGMPVVRMQYFRDRIDVPREFHRRPRKKDKPVQGIRIIAPAFTVRVRPVEIFVPLDSKQAHGAASTLPDPRRPSAVCHGNRQFQGSTPKLSRFFQSPVQRHGHADRMAGLRQRLGKRRGHIRQPAHFGVGGQFCCHE